MGVCVGYQRFMEKPVRFLFAILLLSGCASTAPQRPTASKMPPLPPLPTVKDSLTTAKYAQPAVSEFSQPPSKTLLLKWDYSDYRDGLFFRVYSRPRFASDSPWTIRGEVATNLFVIIADQAQDFFMVSAVNQSGETFSTKP